jgi:hypothetical protein
MPGGRDDGLASLGPITTSGRAAWRGRGSRRRVHGGGRGQHPTGRPGRARPAPRHREPARPRLPPDRHDSRARQRQARRWVADGAGLVAGAVCASAGRPGGWPGRRCVPPAGGGAGVPVLPLVCLRLGLLWLRPRPVVAAVGAAFAPGLAVLSAVARATWWGWFADPVGVWTRLRIRCLPSRASRVRCGFGPGSLLGRRISRRELTRPHAGPAGPGPILGALTWWAPRGPRACWPRSAQRPGRGSSPSPGQAGRVAGQDRRPGPFPGEEAKHTGTRCGAARRRWPGSLRRCMRPKAWMRPGSRTVGQP